MICSKCGNELVAKSAFCPFCGGKIDNADSSAKSAPQRPVFTPPGGFVPPSSHTPSDNMSNCGDENGGFLQSSSASSSPMLALSMCCWIVMLLFSVFNFDIGIGYFSIVSGNIIMSLISCAAPVIFIGGMFVFARNNIQLMLLPMIIYFVLTVLEFILAPVLWGFPAEELLSLGWSLMVFALMVAVTIFVFYMATAREGNAMPIIIWCAISVILYCVLTVIHQTLNYGVFSMQIILKIFSSWSLRDLAFFFGVAFLGLAAAEQYTAI